MNSVGTVFTVGLLTMAFATLAWTQQADTETVPPGQTETTSDQVGGYGEKIDPDTRPLSGAQQLSVGLPESRINVIHSSIALSQMLDSNSTVPGRQNAWVGDSDVFANVSLNRSWSRDSFSAKYNGGGLLNAETELQNTQALALSQVFGWQRWFLRVNDQATYSKQSLFGTPGIPPNASNFLGTSTHLLPNDTIFTGDSTRLANTSIAEAEYQLSHRSSLTATASYGFLHYNSIGDGKQAGLVVGYNYLVSTHNTVAVTYSFDRYKLQDVFPSAVDIQRADALYARHVTGRLNAQIGLGAALAKQKTPLLASGSHVFTDINAGFQYVLPRTEIGLAFTRGLVSGAGIAVASNQTGGVASLSRQLTRKWNATLNTGIYQNSLLGQSSRVRSAHAGAQLRRVVGRHLGVFLGYNFQRQLSHRICRGPVCAGDFGRHVVRIGFDWQFSPLTFR